MRVLVAVAHPDDETFGCGSVLLSAASAGHETAVLCATRGEAGESLVETDDLAALREAELRAAARVMGVGEVRILGYGDSDMFGEPAPGTLCGADTAEVAADIGAVLDELRPDVVITLDGLDGHRDHLAMCEATLAAVDAAAHPPRATYLWCVTRSELVRWARHQAELGGPHDVYLTLGEVGTPDEDVTHTLDMTEHLPQRLVAMREHASQLNPFEGMPEDVRHDFLAHDHLRLVRGEDVLPWD